ncbi:tRNA pseudouridine(55) synthase TruB [Ancylothrix sp. C2]|nr:tRNA pseudouridine(55) synthase TruB [Ancylothrix sp. D3o]
MTSHDCVAKLRRLLRIKKIGHAGTLDPAAVGVLPVAIGKATRLLQFLRDDKAYRATIRLGVQTTTDDLEGEIISQIAVNNLSLETIQDILNQSFIGKIQQIPPNYSAIQIGGKRLYDLARKGEEINVPAREVNIYKIEILDWRPADYPEIDISISCGPGTYIRSIARDLGSALKVGGTLAHLTRTESSGFEITESVTFEKIEESLNQGNFQLISPAKVLSHLAAITLAETPARRWCQGQKIVEFEGENNNFPVQVYNENSTLLGIGKIEVRENGPVLIPEVVLEAN